MPSEQRAYDMTTPSRAAQPSPIGTRRGGVARQRDSNRRTRPQSRRAAAADSTPARSQGALKAKAIDGRGWGWDLRIGAGGCTWRPVPPHLPACQLRRAHARPVWSGPRARARAASSAALRSTTRRASATVAMHSSTAVRATAGSSARAQPHVRALKSWYLRRRSCAPSQPHTTVAG